MEPQHEWLRLQSLHAECLFWLGDFERAESVFEAASIFRQEAALLDWDYIRQRHGLGKGLAPLQRQSRIVRCGHDRARRLRRAWAKNWAK